MINIFPISDINANKKYDVTPTFIFDGEKSSDKFLNLNIDKDCKIVFLNFNDDFTLNCSIYSQKNVMLSFFSSSYVRDINLNIDLKEKSQLTAYFADFIQGDIKMHVNINLNGEECSCVWNLASLSLKEQNKNIDVSVIHNKPNTFSKINNFGVSKDKSKLVFSGICHIKNGSHNSKAHQNAKIMVFDEGCDSIAKPILKIDDNSIEASHAAVVGKISDDQLFYLTSRGLSLAQARELITFGYLKPILAGFENEEIKNIILHKIESEF